MAREGKIMNREAQRALRVSGPAIENFEASNDVEPSVRDEKQTSGVDTFEYVNTITNLIIKNAEFAFNKNMKQRREPDMSEGYRLAHLMNSLHNYLLENLDDSWLFSPEDNTVFTTPLKPLEDMCLPESFLQLIKYKDNALRWESVRVFLSHRFPIDDDQVGVAFSEAVSSLSDPNVILMMIAWSKMLPTILSVTVPPPYNGLAVMLAQLIVGILQKWCESMLRDDSDMSEVRKRVDYYPVLREELMKKSGIDDHHDIIVGGDYFIDDIKKYIPDYVYPQVNDPMIAQAAYPLELGGNFWVLYALKTMFSVVVEAILAVFTTNPGTIPREAVLRFSLLLDFFKFAILFWYYFVKNYFVDEIVENIQYIVRNEEMIKHSGAPEKINTSPPATPDRKGSVCHVPEELAYQLNLMLALPPPQEVQPKVVNFPMKLQASFVKRFAVASIIYMLLSSCAKKLVMKYFPNFSQLRSLSVRRRLLNLLLYAWAMMLCDLWDKTNPKRKLRNPLYLCAMLLIDLEILQCHLSVIREGCKSCLIRCILNLILQLHWLPYRWKICLLRALVSFVN
jgi:hypothetical protein